MGRVGSKKTWNFFLQPEPAHRAGFFWPKPDSTCGQVGFGSDRVKLNFLCILFRSGRAFRVLGQKIGPCPAQFLLRVDNFGRSPAHILSGLVWVGVFSGGLGQVRRVSRPVIRYSSKVVCTRHTLFSSFKRNISS